MMITLLAALGLAAQPAYPSRVGPANPPARQMTDPPRNAEADARRVLLDYAVCVVGRNRARVEEYLRLPFGTDEAARASGRLNTSECLEEGEIRFTGSLLRGALYNALYMASYRLPGPVDFSAAPAVVYQPGDTAAMTPEQHDLNTLGRYADCVVRAGGADARRMVLSRAGSDDEQAAFRALRPVLSACLVQGAQVNFTRTSLRGLIGEALYKLTIGAGAR